MTPKTQDPPGTPHRGTSLRSEGAEPNPIETYQRHR
jgi:hypothetical protein